MGGGAKEVMGELVGEENQMCNRRFVTQQWQNSSIDLYYLRQNQILKHFMHRIEPWHTTIFVCSKFLDTTLSFIRQKRENENMRVKRVEEEEAKVRERREKAKQVREIQTRRGHRGQKGIERERE